MPNSALDPQQYSDNTAPLPENQIEVFTDSIVGDDTAGYFSSIGQTLGGVQSGSITTAAEIEPAAELAVEEASLDIAVAVPWVGLIVGVTSLLIGIVNLLKETEVDTIVILNDTADSWITFDPNWGYIDHGYCASMPLVTGQGLGPGQAGTFVFSSDRPLVGTMGTFGFQIGPEQSQGWIGFYDPYDGSNTVSGGWNVGSGQSTWEQLYETYDSWSQSVLNGENPDYEIQGRVSSISGPTITTHVIITDR